MAYRIESARLDRAERTAAGGLRIPAAIGRSGILEYRKADGTTWREYRPPEEAFAAGSLASLRGAPVTDLHPTRPVSPETYRAVARGHVGDDARKDDDGRHIAASVYVHDADLIREIEAGERRELSAGYETQLDLTAGVTPDGERYDAVQRGIAYNHVAVGPRGWGRAGATVALRLDSAMDVVAERGDAADVEVCVMKITIRCDGVDYTADVDETAARALPAALERERADAARLRAEVETLRTQAEEARVAADAARGRADELEATAAAAASPDVIAALVASRVDLERKAAMVSPGLRCDGLTDRELMARSIGFEAGEAHSDDYVRARFDAAVEQRAKADGSVARAHVAAASSGEHISIAEAARRRMIARQSRGEV